MLKDYQELSILAGWSSTYFPSACPPSVSSVNFDHTATWFFFTSSHGVSFYICISEYLARMKKDALCRFLELFFCIASSFPKLCPHNFQLLTQSFLASTDTVLLCEVADFFFFRVYLCVCVLEIVSRQQARTIARLVSPVCLLSGITPV